MNSNSQTNGLSQAAEFQQGPDGALCIVGVYELRQPLTQGGGSPPSQLSKASQINTFLDYQFTRHDKISRPGTRLQPMKSDHVRSRQAYQRIRMLLHFIFVLVVTALHSRLDKLDNHVQKLINTN